MSSNPLSLPWSPMPALPAELPAVERPGGVQVTTVSDPAGFATLHAEWSDLLAGSSCDGPFMTWSWLSSWWAHLRGGTTLSLRCVRLNGRLIGLAPLALFPADVRAGLPRTLRFLGTGEAGSDYLDVMARPEDAGTVLDALARDLAAGSVPIVLGAMRLRPCLAMGLVWRLEARGWLPCASRQSICPLAELDGHTWDSYLATLGSEHRYAVRRALRSLAARFAVRHEMVTTEPRRRQVLAILAALHERRWRGKQDETAFRTQALRDFHEEASRRFLLQGALRLSLLSVDGWPVAAIYGVMHRRTLHFYQSGFDPSFARFSVGLVAMAESIRAAIEEGAVAYDFLHGTERYKFHWARRFRRLRTVELYPPGRYGRLTRMTRSWVRTGKALARRALRKAA